MIRVEHSDKKAVFVVLKHEECLLSAGILGPQMPPVSIEARRLLPSRWDLLAAILVLGFIVAFADASRFLVHPLSSITGHDLTLNLPDLPGYALRPALRMLIAMGVSLCFTFTYATWAAKNPRAGSLLVPLLDILQSVPILSFLSVTIVWFLSLSPGRVLGAELACVFTIFTGSYFLATSSSVVS